MASRQEPLKLAEKLIILNGHIIGITTRLYNLKKICSQQNTKPTCLQNQSLESGIKYITKRFPTIDVRTGGVQVEQINVEKVTIIKQLQSSFTTMLEVVEVMEHARKLFDIMDHCGIQLDININPDLTIQYLNLVASYISLSILFSRIEDRKIISALFNAAYQFQHGSCEPNFDQLSTFIIEFEQPLKKLSVEFVQHKNLLSMTLKSISKSYLNRNTSSSIWNNTKLMCLFHTNPDRTTSNITICDYFSLDQIDRWIILSLTVCHSLLLDDSFDTMWKCALSGQMCIQLFRDEIIPVHSTIQHCFESIKGFSKQVSQVKQMYNKAVQQSLKLHGERRSYLRDVLEQMILFLHDTPGLLGPKIGFVLMGMSYARDEVIWLVRHIANWSSLVKGGGTKAQQLQTQMNDNEITCLLFIIEELKHLIVKFDWLIRDYHTKYLFGYDLCELKCLMPSLRTTSDYNSLLLTSIIQILSDCKTRKVDFGCLRMDWCRLEANLSLPNNQLNLFDHPKFANHLNCLVFHSKMVDWCGSMISQCGDMSILYFYRDIMINWFNVGLEQSTQMKYLIAFPLITAHFPTVLHNYCPEERNRIVETTFNLCRWFLEILADAIAEHIEQLINLRCDDDAKLFPEAALKLINKCDNKKATTRPKKNRKSKMEPIIKRKQLDTEEHEKVMGVLLNLLNTMQNTKIISLCQSQIKPGEFVAKALENKLLMMISTKTNYNSKQDQTVTSLITKPSEMLKWVKTMIDVIQTMQPLISIDLLNIMKRVITTHMMADEGSKGFETMTMQYTKWYINVLVSKFKSNLVAFSPHQQLIMVTPKGKMADIDFDAQQFTNVAEIRALCELLGCFGIDYFMRRLSWQIGLIYQEIIKMVAHNKEVLIEMRSNYGFRQKKRFHELQKILIELPKQHKQDLKPIESDQLLRNVAHIGAIMCFQDHIQKQLKFVLRNRVPYLMTCVDEFMKCDMVHSNVDRIETMNMAAACGAKTQFDVILLETIKSQRKTAEQNKAASENSDEKYMESCLLIELIAVCLPRLVHLGHLPQCSDKIGAYSNNAHCISKAVNELSMVLFEMHAKRDVIARMKEFLAVSSACLLQTAPIPKAIFSILDGLIENSEYLDQQDLELCLPYVLLQCTFNNVNNDVV